MTGPTADVTVVVPTLGRASLPDCLGALAAATGPPPREVVLVDDRPHPEPDDLVPGLAALSGLRERTRVLHGGGRGPAAARNTGWRAANAPWVVFVDEGVQVGPHWHDELGADLAAASPDVAGVQGVLDAPLPRDRRPTDRERNTAGLAHALWSTTDMAYRTEALKQAGGFDERFRHACRGDTDLALRVLDAGLRIRRGGRHALHPVRPAGRWASLRAKRGKADDALMLHLHGPGWWSRAAVARGRIDAHLAITGAGLAALALSAVRGPRAAAPAAAGWALGTAEFAWTRIAPGPRTRSEVTELLLTSAAIPPAAAWHWCAGLLRHRRAGPWEPAP